MGAEQKRKTSAGMSQGLRGHYPTGLFNPTTIIYKYRRWFVRI